MIYTVLPPAMMNVGKSENITGTMVFVVEGGALPAYCNVTVLNASAFAKSRHTQVVSKSLYPRSLARTGLRNWTRME